MTTQVERVHLGSSRGAHLGGTHLGYINLGEHPGVEPLPPPRADVQLHRRPAPYDTGRRVVSVKRLGRAGS
jgi:hypothetical protein